MRVIAMRLPRLSLLAPGLVMLAACGAVEETANPSATASPSESAAPSPNATANPLTLTATTGTPPPTLGHVDPDVRIIFVRSPESRYGPVGPLWASDLGGNFATQITPDGVDARF